MGLLFLAVCAGAIFANEGAMRLAAVAITVLNTLALITEMRNEQRATPEHTVTLAHFLTVIVGAFLLVYGVAT